MGCKESKGAAPGVVPDNLAETVSATKEGSPSAGKAEFERVPSAGSATGLDRASSSKSGSSMARGSARKTRCEETMTKMDAGPRQLPGF